MKEYALYKGEQMVAVGTIKEIAEERGVKPKRLGFTVHLVGKDVLLVKITTGYN